MVVITETISPGQVSIQTEKCIVCPLCKKKIHFWASMGSVCYKCGDPIPPFHTLINRLQCRINYYLMGKQLEENLNADSSGES